MWRKHRSCVLWRRGPCGRNSQGLVLLDVPFSFAGPDRFQNFPCEGLIPTSGVNPPPPRPATCPTWTPAPAPPRSHSASSLRFRFLLPLFLASPTSHLWAVLGQVCTTPSNPFLLPQRAWLHARPTSPSEVDFLYHFIASCQNSWPGPFPVGSRVQQEAVVSPPRRFDTSSGTLSKSFPVSEPQFSLLQNGADSSFF